jgi:hypothetical protein
MGFVSLEDIYRAYRKAKVDVFYDSTLNMEVDFCIYEQSIHNNIQRLYNNINDPHTRWHEDSSLYGGYSLIPKSIKNKKKESDVSPSSSRSGETPPLRRTSEIASQRRHTCRRIPTDRVAVRI